MRTLKLTRAGALRQTYFLIWPNDPKIYQIILRPPVYYTETVADQ